MRVEEVFKKPVKRSDLAKVLKCETDRQARNKLSKLQEKFNIINLQDGNGYFLATDEQTIRYAEQEIRRAVKSFNKAREMIKRCDKSNGYKIPVKAHFRRINKADNSNQISFI